MRAFSESSEAQITQRASAAYADVQRSFGRGQRPCASRQAALSGHDASPDIKERAMKTMTKIDWATSLEDALARAKDRSRPVYVDFFEPT